MFFQAIGTGIIPVIPRRQRAVAGIQAAQSGVLVRVADAEVDSHGLGEF